MAIVTGVLTIRAAIVLMTRHALTMKGVSPGGNVFNIRTIFFGELAIFWNVIMTAKTGILVREGRLVFLSEGLVERRRMTGTTGDGLVLPNTIVMTVATVEAVVLGMGEVGKDDSSACVIKHYAGGNILLLLG